MTDITDRLARAIFDALARFDAERALGLTLPVFVSFDGDDFISSSQREEAGVAAQAALVVMGETLKAAQAAVVAADAKLKVAEDELEAVERKLKFLLVRSSLQRAAHHPSELPPHLKAAVRDAQMAPEHDHLNVLLADAKNEPVAVPPKATMPVRALKFSRC